SPGAPVPKGSKAWAPTATGSTLDPPRPHTSSPATSTAAATRTSTGSGRRRRRRRGGGGSAAAVAASGGRQPVAPLTSGGGGPGRRSGEGRDGVALRSGRAAGGRAPSRRGDVRSTGSGR